MRSRGEGGVRTSELFSGSLLDINSFPVERPLRHARRNTHNEDNKEPFLDRRPRDVDPDLEANFIVALNLRF